MDEKHDKLNNKEIKREQVFLNQENDTSLNSFQHYSSFNSETMKCACLPPLIVPRRYWSPQDVSTNNPQTFTRGRSRSVNVPAIVVTPDIEREDEKMLRKSASSLTCSSDQLRIHLPRIEDKGRLAPPMFDSSSRATYAGLRRNSCPVLPKLFPKKRELQKE